MMYGLCRTSGFDKWVLRVAPGCPFSGGGGTFVRVLKVVLVLFLLICIRRSGSAQNVEWAPVGAKWHYQMIWDPLRPNYVTFVNITSLQDTVIEDRSYRKLDISAGTTTDQVLVRQDGKKLLRLFDGQDVVLYDFSLNIGDTLFLKSFVEPFGCHKDQMLVLDTVYSISVNGTTRLKQVFEPILSLDYGAEVVEGIGSVGNWFLPTCTSAGDQNWLDGFRCYEDEVIGLYQASTVECDFEGMTSSVWSTRLSTLEVFPNPFSDLIKVQIETASNQNNLFFSMTDLMGVKIMQGQLSRAGVIDFQQHLPSATIVFLTIFDISQGPIATIKLISK